MPADLPAERTEELRRLAVECYRAVECEGMARVDFLYKTASENLYINEINTIPGSPPSACTPRCGSTAGLVSANCWTG